MAQHTYSPTLAARKSKQKRELDHVRIHPAKGGFLVEHHHKDGDGIQIGSPDQFVHETLDGLHTHLDQFLAEHEPEHGENAEPTKA